MPTRDGRGLSLGGLLLGDLLASGTIGTPSYVYDLDAIGNEVQAIRRAFGARPHFIAYAMKANSAAPIVRTIHSAGAGMEVVSGAELRVALGCGVDPERILYSSVGKRDAEIDQAIGAGNRGIKALQLESVEEIDRVDARARALGRRARISLRVNPGVVADTHPHVATGHDEAKFGIARSQLHAAWESVERATHVDLCGLSQHVGSQLTQVDAYLEAAGVLLEIATVRQRIDPTLKFIDFGGGFGIDYGQGCSVAPADFVQGLLKLLEGSELSALEIEVEPGRSVVGAHGVLCASVIGTKQGFAHGEPRRWLIIDAGMNDLLRPALYGALHRVEPVNGEVVASAPTYRVVGPICESSDDFGAHPFAAVPAHVVIRDAGAYGFTMASEYNGRPLPTEVFVGAGRIVATSTPRSVDRWVAERLAIQSA